MQNVRVKTGNDWRNSPILCAVRSYTLSHPPIRRTGKPANVAEIDTINSTRWMRIQFARACAGR
jgi:hypothetical protein